MTDLEARLVDTLAHEADEAPDPSGLAARARTRARRRRRTRLGVVAAGTLVAVVPTVLLATSGSVQDLQRPTPIAVDPTPAATPAVPEGWRVVRWGDLEVSVPGNWEDGARSSWCVNQGSVEEARVELPDQGRFDIACAPSQSFGVTVGDVSAASFAYPSGHVWRYDVDENSADRVDVYVPDSWLGYWYDDERLVQVNAADRETVQSIVDSVRRISR